MAPKNAGEGFSWGPLSHAFGQFIGLFSPSDFTILWRPGRPVVVRGRVARAKMPGIVQFFSRDLNLSGPLTVRGNRGRPPGSLRLRFAGEIGAGDRQRVRNFLMAHLK